MINGNENEIKINQKIERIVLCLLKNLNFKFCLELISLLD